MKIESKFLTADAEVLALRIEGRVMVIEGRVKGFMPVVIRVGPEDLRALARLLTANARASVRAAVSRHIGRAPEPHHRGPR